MNHLNDDSQYIEDYLRNDLTANEKLAFNDRLKNDPVFAKLAKNHKQFFEVVQSEKHLELKSFLQEVESKHANGGVSLNKPQAKSKIKSFFISVLAFLFALILFNLLFNNSKTTEELYMAYYKSYPNTLVKTERGSVDDSDLRQAMEAFTEGRHNQAITQFDQILKIKDNNKIQFYKALSMLESGQTQESLQLLEDLKSLNDTSIIEALRWYTSLAFLKADSKTEALEALNELIQSGQTYQKTNATKLIKELEN